MANLTRKQIEGLLEIRRRTVMEKASFCDPDLTGGDSDIAGITSRYRDKGNWDQRYAAFSDDVRHATRAYRDDTLALIDELLGDHVPKSTL